MFGRSKALRVLEAEVARLRNEMTQVRVPAEQQAVSRRSLLRSVGSAAAAGVGIAVAGEALRPGAAGAVVTDTVDASSATGSPAVRGINTSTGVGVWGQITNASSANAAVYGETNGPGAALWGRSTSASGTTVLIEHKSAENASSGVFIRNDGAASALFALSSAVGSGIRVETNGAAPAVVVQNSAGRGIDVNSIGTALTLVTGGSGGPLRLVGGSSLPSGTLLKGEFALDGAGDLHACKVAGPGVWIKVGFTAIAPTRILDTRPGDLPDHAGDHKLSAGEQFTVPVATRLSLPAGASAVALNITAVDPSANGGFMSLYPDNLNYSPASPPTFSNVNFNAGQVVANSATVKLGPTGGIKVYNALGNTHVIIDVAGFYS